MYDLVICVSDMHIPFEHPDLVPYLRAIKDKYWSKAKRPLVVIGGDEVSWHSISYHDHDPAMPNPARELELSLPLIKAIHNLFPKAYVLESNHGSLVYRKQKSAGLPRGVIKSYNEILRVSKSWRWVNDLTIKLNDGSKCYFCHGITKDVTKLSQSLGISAVQFHYHENYKIEYWQSKNGLRFAMQAGCLIDNNSPDFSYNKINLKTPIIGTGVIVNSKPELVPMILDKRGRWIGKL